MKEAIFSADNRNSQIQAFIKFGGNELYKTLLKRNYKIPKAYIQWEELAGIFSLIAPLFNNISLDFERSLPSSNFPVKQDSFFC